MDEQSNFPLVINTKECVVSHFQRRQIYSWFPCRQWKGSLAVTRRLYLCLILIKEVILLCRVPFNPLNITVVFNLKIMAKKKLKKQMELFILFMLRKICWFSNLMTDIHMTYSTYFISGWDPWLNLHFLSWNGHRRPPHVWADTAKFKYWLCLGIGILNIPDTTYCNSEVLGVRFSKNVRIETNTTK